MTEGTQSAPATGLFSRGARRMLGVLFGLAWVVSLVFPAAYLQKGDQIPGIVVLMFGWFGLFMFQLAWLANFAFLLTLPVFALKDRSRSVFLRISGVFLLFCAASAFFWSDWPDDSSSNPVVAFGSGFYLWIFAVAGTGISALAWTLTEPKPA